MDLGLHMHVNGIQSPHSPVWLVDEREQPGADELLVLCVDGAASGGSVYVKKE